jgi:hypothetical protein
MPQSGLVERDFALCADLATMQNLRKVERIMAGTIGLGTGEGAGRRGMTRLSLKEALCCVSK